MKHAKNPEMICHSGRMIDYDREMLDDGASCGRRGEKENEGGQPDNRRMQPGRQVKGRPIDKFSPDHALDGKTAPPRPVLIFERRLTAHASTVAGAEFCVPGTGADETNIKRKFVSSAFHQRNNPLRKCFMMRESGTKPS